MTVLAKDRYFLFLVKKYNAIITARNISIIKIINLTNIIVLFQNYCLRMYP